MQEENSGNLLKSVNDMKIKKIGHCCLLIQVNGLTILTDPGAFSTDQDKLTGIDVVLITHEHTDHFHVNSMKEILKNNPQVKVITNSGVAKQLDGIGIVYSLLEGRDQIDIQGISLQAFDCKHEEIFEEVGQVQNTGYFINNKLFYPGDSFCNPERSIDVLALPVAGPWCKVSDSIRYALTVRPNKVFPVHDGMLQTERIGASHKIPEKVLTEHGINFIVINNGEEQEF